VPGSVTITTMHGGKGLSADVVFVLQAEDEVIPDHLAGIEYDESRRLLYVSLTRAKQTLVISTCVQRNQLDFVADEPVSTQRTLTRFLADYGLQTAWGNDYHTVG
jgi:DNA helicase-2/ATP-dependent DNA helicase PcrA